MSPVISITVASSFKQQKEIATIPIKTINSVKESILNLVLKNEGVFDIETAFQSALSAYIQETSEFQYLSKSIIVVVLYLYSLLSV